MEYLLNYMEDYEIENLKELYTDEIINLLIEEKDNVIRKIEELKQNGEEDIYDKITKNIEIFINL